MESTHIDLHTKTLKLVDIEISRQFIIIPGLVVLLILGLKVSPRCCRPTWWGSVKPDDPITEHILRVQSNQFVQSIGQNVQSNRHKCAVQRSSEEDCWTAHL